jgi:hypothetical protein
MVGEVNTTAQDNNQTLGLLVANFGQNFTGKNVANVVLGAIDLKQVASFATPTYTNVGNMIDTTTMDHAHGQQINVPIGLTTFNLQMFKDGYGALLDANNVSASSTHQYYIILQFELFN